MRIENNNNFETFTERFETFLNYKGLCNEILLAINNFYHFGDDKICCKNCKNVFICWRPEEKFWIRHNQSSCSHILQMYLVSIEPVSDEIFNSWSNKKSISDIKIKNNYSDEEFKAILREYLNFKGSHASYITFKEFVRFKRDFS